MKIEYLPEVERLKIYPEERKELAGLKNYLTRYEDGYFYDPRFKILKIWNGKNTQFESEDNTVPLGLWKEVYKCCYDFGYPFEFVNKKDFPLNKSVKEAEFNEFVLEFFKEYKYKGKQFELRDYQIRSAYNILKNRYCNIAVATAGGKTLIYALVLFYLLKKHPDKKFLLVVPSKTLVTQFYDDLNNFNWQKEINLNAQEIFDLTEKPRTYDADKEVNLVIGTFQSLIKYKKPWFQQFWSITTDEGHKSDSASYKKILKRTFLNAYYRWGMSGSYAADDTEEMMQIMAHTGPLVDTVKAKELMDKGYITKVKIKRILLNHNNYEFAENLKMVAARDKKACYDLECAKIQESDDRLIIINKIVSECKQNTLVLFHNTEYGEKLLAHLEKNNPDKIFHYIDGKISNKKRTPIKAMMENTDVVNVLVASYGTLSTGVSIDAITNVIFTQSFKKAQLIIQSIGRALRLHPDKKFAYIFDLIDVFNTDSYIARYSLKFKNILADHGDKRIKIYEDEEYPYSTIEINLKDI